jgi:hypothetical protein
MAITAPHKMDGKPTAQNANQPMNPSSKATTVLPWERNKRGGQASFSAA